MSNDNQVKKSLVVLGVAFVIQAIFAVLVVFRSIPEDPYEATQALHRNQKAIALFFLLVNILLLYYFWNTSGMTWG